MKLFCSATSWIAAAITLFRTSVQGAGVELSVVDQEGFEHPDAHINGFVLTEVFLHHATSRRASFFFSSETKHTVTRRKLRFNDRVAEDVFTNMKQEYALVDASPTLNPAKVRALSKFNFINTEFDWSFYQFEPPEGEGYFDATGKSASYEATIALWKAAEKEAERVAAETDSTLKRYDTPATVGKGEEYDTPGPSGVARREVGIACLRFSRGNDTVLVFRDTVSQGDLDNILSWIIAPILDTKSPMGMTESLKGHWESAGLEWGEEQRKRAAESDFWYRAILHVAMRATQKMSGFCKKLATAVNGKKVGGDGEEVFLSQNEVMEQGYWPVTKAVVEQVRKDLPKGGRILFSGYSQGGARAQLARMYTEKRYGEQWPVVTFAAVGPACFPRSLNGAGSTDLLDDVDPTKYYEDVTDYQLFFDPWGSALGVDVGKACFLGKHDIENSRQYKYCHSIYGYSGARLFGSETFGKNPVGQGFVDCRFVTHSLVYIMEELSKDEELNEDGTTLGGCINYEGAALDSGLCPVENMSLLYWTYFLLAIIVSLILTGVFLVSRLVMRQITTSRSKKDYTEIEEETPLKANAVV